MIPKPAPFGQGTGGRGVCRRRPRDASVFLLRQHTDSSDLTLCSAGYSIMTPAPRAIPLSGSSLPVRAFFPCLVSKTKLARPLTALGAADCRQAAVLGPRGDDRYPWRGLA